MNKPVSWFAHKQVALLKRLGIYPTPIYIPVYFKHRSGSTVHGATLDTHPHCVSLNEAFEYYLDKQLDLNYNNFLKPIQDHRLYKRALKGKYLTHCFLQFNSHYFPVFKHPYDYEAMFSFVGKNFPGMVYIHRRNTLKKLVSTLRARTHQVWHEEKDIIFSKKEKKIHIDLESNFKSEESPKIGLINNLTRLQRNELIHLELARKHVPNLLELVYEEDIEPDVMIGVQKVLDFFNVPASAKPLNVPLAKTSRGLQYDIENYNEVYACLKDSPHAWMLD